MKRHLLFLASLLLSLVVFFAPIRAIVKLGLDDGVHSHILLIPLISGFFLYWGRKEIFSHVEYNFLVGLFVTLIACAIGLAEMLGSNRLPLSALSMWLSWIGLFICFYGFRAFRFAVFPFLFLLFMVPMPYSLVQKPVMLVLQDASGEVVNMLFFLIGVPVVRDGHIFHLPGFSIEVTDNCGGIRSGISLIITCIIAAKLFLHTGWIRSVAVIAMFPTAILLNGIRIVVLSVLGLYVDERLLTGDLHMDGSKAWFALSLLVVWAVIVLLRKIESRHSAAVIEQTMPETPRPKVMGANEHME